MKVRLAGARLHLRRSLPKVTTILAGIVALIVFYPLTGCANLGGTPDVRTTLATAMTPTATMPTKTSISTTATPMGQSSPWKLVWNDEFDGPKGAPPDPSKWTPEIGGEGWGNRQLEYDTNNQNAYQDGQGNLVLEARRDNPAGYKCWYGSCQYTSSRITTSGHFDFTYGYLEARIKIPYGQGIWSAFWLLGNNCATVGWPTCGEIDVMENISQEPASIHGTVHGPGYFTGMYTLQHGKFSDDFHVFALKWDANHLYFLVDGNNYATLNRTTLTTQAYWVYNHPFNIVLNLPIGGNWPGSPSSSTIFPQRMYVSYVRLYEPAA